MLEPCDAKVSSTVLRGLGDRKVAWLLGNVTDECCSERKVRLEIGYWMACYRQRLPFGACFVPC